MWCAPLSWAPQKQKIVQGGPNYVLSRKCQVVYKHPVVSAKGCFVPETENGLQKNLAQLEIQPVDQLPFRSFYSGFFGTLSYYHLKVFNEVIRVFKGN